MYLQKVSRTQVLDMIKTGQQSQAEIGRLLGVSRQRIKQIAMQAGLDAYQLRSIIREQQIRTKKEAKWGKNRQSGTPLYDACRAKFRQKKANSHKWEWTISFGDINWPSHCPILGLELDYFADVRQENSPSIDRIDSTKGYIPGNVVVCSWRANRLKNDGTAQEHLLIAQFLSQVK